jgi:diguanylate cyclase (GGDEF)-like protein
MGWSNEGTINEDTTHQLLERLQSFVTNTGSVFNFNSLDSARENIAGLVAGFFPDQEFSGFLEIGEDPEYYFSGVVDGRKLAVAGSHEIILELKESTWHNTPVNEAVEFTATPASLKSLTKAQLLCRTKIATPASQFGWLLAGMNRPFKEQEIQFFYSLSVIAAIALEKASQLQALQETVSEINQLNHFASEITETLNPEELIQYFLKTAAELLPFDRASIYILSTSNQINHAYSAVAPYWRVRRKFIDISLKGKPLETFVKNRESVVNPTPAEPIFPNQAASRLLLPLVTRDRVFGILAISSQHPGLFIREKLPLTYLEKLATILTPALINSRRYEEKQIMADVDNRVGIFNHDYFERELPLQVEKAQRLNYRLGLVIADMDDLKMINTRYNYLIGSAALRHIAQIMVRCVRRTDIVARYGGDEFTILLPGCSPEGLELVSETVRRAIQQNPMLVNENEKLSLSVSVGAALYPVDASSGRELFEKANAALQEAKQIQNHVRIGGDARHVRVNTGDLRRFDQRREEDPEPTQL